MAGEKKSKTDYDDTVPIDSIVKDDPLRYVGDARRTGSDGLYQFAVLDGQKVIDALSLFPNPQSISLQEPSATSITAMQGGGKYIERRGNIFKDLVIAGTTGFMPNARAATYNEFQQRFRISDDDTAASKMAPVSGYVKFHETRNFFRRYQNIFRSGKREDVKEIRFIWINYKDEEFWVIEPLLFATTRDKSNPMSYMYSITARFIDMADKALFKAEAIPLSRGMKVLAAIKSIVTTIERAISVVGAIIAEVSEAVRAIINTALSLATRLAGALNNLVAGVSEIVRLPLNTVKSCTSAFKQCLDTARNVGQAFTLDVLDVITQTIQACHTLAAMPELFVNSFSEEWQKRVQNFNRVTQKGSAIDFTSQLDLNDLTEDEILPGETIQRVAARVLGDASRFHELIVLNNLQAPYISPNARERLPNTLAPNDTILVPKTFGRQSATNPIPVSGSKARSEPTVTSVAASGTPTSLTVNPALLAAPWRPNQWKNFLCTFISGTGFGTTVLVESNTETQLTFNKAVTTPDATTIFQLSSAQQKVIPPGSLESLGIDIRLTPDNDFAKTVSGDLASVRFLENMDQAIQIKMKTEQLDLVLHSFFGLRQPAGTKVTPASVSQHRLNARRTFVSDPRIALVKHLRLRAIKDTISVDGEVELKFNGTGREFKGES